MDAVTVRVGVRGGENGRVQALPAARQPIVTLRRVVISVLIAVGVGGLILAFSEGKSEPPTVTVAGVESVSPQPNTLALRQDRVIADLQTGFDGVLQIDGIEIPDDQLQRTIELGIVSFAPGPEKEFDELAPGRHRARVIFWPVSEGRGEENRTFEWFFNVH